jgi:ech hydrogenase subunit A
MIVLILAFGSAATLFYWTKWLGKLVAVLNKSERLPSRIRADEWVSLATHAIMTIVVCFVFPLIASSFIEPYLTGIFGSSDMTVIAEGSVKIMSLMLGMILLIPVGLFIFVLIRPKGSSPLYGGCEHRDNRIMWTPTASPSSFT